jgi:Zn-dependent protease with chaperone function
MIAWPLVLFAAAVAVMAPRVLSRARWVYQSPHLGIVAWYATLTAVASALLATAAVLAHPWRSGTPPVCLAWQWCLQAARGQHGTAGRTVTAVLAAAAVLLAGRLLICGVRFARDHHTRRRQQQRLLTLAGREVAELGATVVPSAQPAAYMVAGPGRRVVVTTGAVAALDAEELAAVLAHERAHSAGRHDVILATVRLLTVAFPWSSLLRTAAQQLSRLVEMRADEVAVTQHRRIVLARALVAMASASPVIPANAVGATGGDAMVRLERLLDPPARLSVTRKACIAAGLAVTAAAPVLSLVTVWSIPALKTCLLLSA